MSTAAVVLAAGESCRFGSPKQQLLLPEVLARLRESPVDEIVVVEGAHVLEPAPYNMSQGNTSVRIVRCPAWTRGPGASLRCGLTALGPNVDSAVVVLADGPDLSPQADERVRAVSRAADGTVAASYEGHRGHPLVLRRELWDDIPDEGLHRLPVRLVPCDDLGAPGDVDEPDDLPSRLRSSG